MVVWFDESRLDDDRVLAGADAVLRSLASSGARVRRDTHEADDAVNRAINTARATERPRAVVAAGPDSRLLRAVLEPWCPVPFVAWPAPALPGWAGPMDLVVVLSPEGGEVGTASAVAEAVRRGCQVVVACPEGSLVAEHAAGRWSSVLPTVSRDALGTAVVMLEFLDRVGLGPKADAEEVAASLDTVAERCSPHHDLSVNPAKMSAIALADTNPVVFGGSVLAARAARRVAESLRRATGWSAVAGDVDQLLPLLEATARRDTFADPYADPTHEAQRRPLLLVLDDGADEPLLREARTRLQAAAAERGIRIETLESTAESEVARYAELWLKGTYSAQYLAIGLTED